MNRGEWIRASEFSQMRWLLFFLLWVPAWAQVPSFDYPVLEPTPEEQRVLKLASEFMAGYYRRLGYRLPSTVRIHLFPDLQSHVAYQEQLAELNRTPYSPPPRIVLNPFYSRSRMEICTWRTANLQRTLIHETSHALFSFSQDPPTWLNEGLAELFANMSFPGGKPRVEPDPKQILELTHGFDPGRLGGAVMRVADLSYEAFHQQAIRRDNYRDAWALVYFLHRTGKLEGMIPRILANREPGQKHSQVLSLAYLGGLQALTRQMELFYRSEFKELTGSL